MHHAEHRLALAVASEEMGHLRPRHLLHYLSGHTAPLPQRLDGNGELQGEVPPRRKMRRRGSRPAFASEQGTKEVRSAHQPIQRNCHNVEHDHEVNKAIQPLHALLGS